MTIFHRAEPEHVMFQADVSENRSFQGLVKVLYAFRINKGKNKRELYCVYSKRLLKNTA